MSSFLQTIRAESSVDIEQLPAYRKLGLSKDALAGVGVMEESEGFSQKFAASCKVRQLFAPGFRA